MTEAARPTAAVVIIGNEVLGGKVADANGPYLIERLREAGVQLCRLEIIADDREAIGDAVRRASASHDLVFTTGGVGPTHDDITMEAIAAAFGVGTEIAPRIAALVRTYFRERTTDAHLRLAQVPAGSVLLGDDTPPWPTVRYRNIYILPGIPRLVRAKIDQLAPTLGGLELWAGALWVDAAEADLCEVLDPLVAAHAGVEIGSYPRKIDGAWVVRLTVEGLDEAAVTTALDALADGFADRLDRREPIRSNRASDG